MPAIDEETSERAIVAVIALVCAVAMVAISRARIADLQRFCVRRGFAYEFLFAVSWLVLVTATTVAVARFVRAAIA